jgi:tape measure domain-containing protein
MSDVIQQLAVTIEARTAAFEKALNRIEKQNKNAFQRIERDGKKHLSGLESALKSTSAKMNGSALAGSIKGGIAGLFAGFSLQGAKQLVDASTRIQNALKATGLEGEALTSVYGKLFAAAQKNAAPIESLAGLYSKVAISQKELGVSSEELVSFTENIALALRAGGTDANAASGALLQLSQALGGGTVRAEEFNSVLEGAPTILRAVAAGMTGTGGSVAKLRQMVIAGQVSSKEFFDAFQRGAPMLERQVAGSVLTISQAFTQLNNSLINVAGKLDQSTGASAAFANFIGGDLAKAVEELGGILDSVSESSIGRFIGKISGAIDEVVGLGAAIGRVTGLDQVGASIGATEEQRASRAAYLAAQHVKAVDSATSAVNRFFTRLERGYGQGIFSPEQEKSIARLKQQLRDGTIEAEGAKAAMASILDDAPQLSKINSIFAPLIDRLVEVTKAAEEAARATAKIDFVSQDERGQMLKDRRADTAYAGMIRDAETEASKSQFDKEVDARAKQLIDAADKLGVAMTEAAAKVEAARLIGLEQEARTFDAVATSAASLIKQFEGFRATPYWDKNAYRVGYGSDTVTLDDGSIRRVTQGMSVSLADANRDLARRIGEFQRGIQSDIGADVFRSLTEQQQAALTSIAYNYGSLPDRIIDALKGGDAAGVYSAIKGLGSDNGGVNQGRRNQEAAMFLQGASPDVQRGVESSENFAQILRDHQQYVASLQAETAIRASLNPLVDDYGRAMSTLEAAQYLLTAAQQEGTAAGRELADVQQLLHGDLSNLSPAARDQAMAMRELANATGEAKAKGNELAESQANLSNTMAEFKGLAKDVLGGFIRDLIAGKSASEALGNALSKIGDKLLDMALNSLFDGLFGGGGGGFPAAPGGGLYAEGGYTGPGGKYDAAGLVHAGEYVFSAQAVRRAGVRNLDAMHQHFKGYADGGLVGGENGRTTFGGGGGRDVNVIVSVDDDGNLKAYVQKVAAVTTKVGVEQLAKQTPAIAINAIADARSRNVEGI